MVDVFAVRKKRARGDPGIPAQLQGAHRFRILLDGAHVAAADDVVVPGATGEALRNLRAVATAAALAGLGGDVARGVAGVGAASASVTGRVRDAAVVTDAIATAPLDEWAAEAVRGRGDARTIEVWVYDEEGRRSSALKLAGARPLLYDADDRAGGPVQVRRLVLSHTDVSWVIDSIEATASVASLPGRDSPPCTGAGCFARGAAGAVAAVLALTLAMEVGRRAEQTSDRAPATARTRAQETSRDCAAGRPACETVPSLGPVWTLPPSSPRPERVTPEPVTPEPVTPEPVTPEPVTPEPVTPEPVTPEPVTPEPVTPEPVTPEPVTPTPEPVPPTSEPPAPPGPPYGPPWFRSFIGSLFDGWPTFDNLSFSPKKVGRRHRHPERPARAARPKPCGPHARTISSIAHSTHPGCARWHSRSEPPGHRSVSGPRARMPVVKKAKLPPGLARKGHLPPGLAKKRHLPSRHPARR